MKKLLISLIIILFVISLSSCATENPDATQPPEESTPIAESTPVPESTPPDVDEEQVEFPVYSFKSIEDFELYCKTGSKDVSLYKNPPSLFPDFKMKDGVFVNLDEVFPDLDMESITVDHIEVEVSDMYYCSCYTKNGTKFDVVFQYNENATEVSADNVIEQLASHEYYARSKIIKGDYYTSKFTSEDWRVSSVYYVFDVDDYVVRYYADTRGNLINIWIYHDNYEIGIGSYNESNREAFFADKVLKPMTDLFSDGEARIEALNKIKQFTESKK